MDAPTLHDAILALSEDEQREVARCVLTCKIPYEMTPAGMLVDVSALSPTMRRELVDAVPALRGGNPPLPPQSASEAPRAPLDPRRSPAARGGSSALGAVIKRLSRPSGFATQSSA